MRLPEQRLNDWIAKWLAGRALVERVENRVKRDTPDIFVATPEWAGWIESKVLPAFPKRPTTAVRLEHWTTGQRYFMQRLRPTAAKGWLVCRVADEVFVFNGAKLATHGQDWTESDWRAMAVVVQVRNDHGGALLAALGAVC